MVVPLKLTQFYGHSVPRPRIYAAVKFSDHRVDPPPSVNDALLSWASDAHWSMGGLSFKRFRTQGKVEGNVRRLRAFVEEDEDVPDISENAKAVARKVVRKPAENADKVKSTATKEAIKPVEKKRQRSEEESVEATPARKLRKRDFLEESHEEGSPAFVPATEEKVQRIKGKARAEPAEVTSAHNVRKKGLRSPSTAEEPVAETPSSVAATGERRREKLFSASGKSLHGSQSPASNGKHTTEASPASKGGRLTRSGKKAFREDASVSAVQASEDASVSAVQASKERPSARKILTRGSLASDEESSESDDGLEAFLAEKGRPPRRSTRLVKEEQGNSLHNSSSVSDSDSE